jgi:hypothetical protein
MSGTIFNVRIPQDGLRILHGVALAGLFALALILFLWYIDARVHSDGDGVSVDHQPSNPVRGVILGAVLLLPTAVLPALSIKHWAPYYAAFPAVGAAIIIGSLSAKIPRHLFFTGISLFVVAGLIGRSDDLGRPRVPTEASYGALGQRLVKVKRRLMNALPKPTHGATIYISDHTLDFEMGRYLFYYQAPRTWYEDPTLVVREPEDWQTGSGVELLLWISRDLEIGTVELGGRENALASSDETRAIRAYALGRGAGGDVFNACRLRACAEFRVSARP